MSYESRVIADGASHLWTLGGASSPLADAVGAVTLTVAGGVTLSQSGIPAGGNSVLLNGTTGKLTPSASVTLNYSGFTVEAWVKPTGGTSFACIFTRGSAEGLFYRPATGLLDWFSGGSHTSSAALNSGAWNHVAAVSSGGTVTLYVNGASAGSSSGYAGSVALDVMGCDPGGEALAGNMTEVATYPSALAGATIAAHYAAGLTTFDPTQMMAACLF